MRPSNEEKFNKKRLISNYLSIVVSISLVLFLTGVMGLMLLNSKKIADHFREQIAMTIYIKDSAKEIEIKHIQKALNLKKATKKVNFVSKEEAYLRHSKEIGENFIEFLGYNPLMSSIDVYFRASFLNPALVSKLSGDLKRYKYVSEVVYDEPLLGLLEKNIKKIKLGIIISSGFFFLIAVLLINSSIRLSIYSKRLIIKTMQLVGATKGFIRAPFIKTHLLIGFIGGIISLAGLVILIHQVNLNFPELKVLENPIEPAIIFASVMIMGLGITLISTFFATQRYLNLKSDAVY